MVSDSATTSSGTREIDSAGSQPRYLQIYRRLAEDIAQGVFASGSHLPAERILCEQLETSRVTLRRALDALAKDGLIEPVAGRGWFVSTGPISHAHFVSFTTMGRKRGLQASARVLNQRIRPATLDQAEALGIAPASNIFELERLRFLDGVVIAIDHSQVPLQRCPALPEVDWNVASLYQVLEEQAGIIPTRCSYLVEALPADERSAQLLEMPTGAPLLVNGQIVYDQYDRVIELGRIVYRYDRFRFRAEQTRENDIAQRVAP